MPGAETVSTLLTETAPLAELLSLNEYPGENTWALIADEETTIFAEYDEARECLILWGDVGEPRPEARLACYEKLLHYNSQWMHTGGLTLSLEESGGKVMLSWATPLAGLGPMELSVILKNFTGALGAWRTIIAQDAMSDGEQADSDSTIAREDYGIPFIRV